MTERKNQTGQELVDAYDNYKSHLAGRKFSLFGNSGRTINKPNQRGQGGQGGPGAATGDASGFGTRTLHSDALKKGPTPMDELMAKKDVGSIATSIGNKVDSAMNSTMAKRLNAIGEAVLKPHLALGALPYEIYDKGVTRGLGATARKFSEGVKENASQLGSAVVDTGAAIGTGLYEGFTGAHPRGLEQVTVIPPGEGQARMDGKRIAPTAPPADPNLLTDENMRGTISVIGEPGDVALRAENTDDGRYASGYNNYARIGAAHELYNAEQMEQVAANTRASDAHLAYIDEQEAAKKLGNIRRGVAHGYADYGVMSARERGRQVRAIDETMVGRDDNRADIQISRQNSGALGRGRIAQAEASMAASEAAGRGNELDYQAKMAEIEGDLASSYRGQFASGKDITSFMADVMSSDNASMFTGPEGKAKLESMALQWAGPEVYAQYLEAQKAGLVAQAQAAFAKMNKGAN